MKKRLRKKLRKKEFAEYGRRVAIDHSLDDAYEFLDRFIEAVETESCSCGGSTSRTSSDMVIELGTRSDDLTGRFNRILKTLQTDPSIKSIAYSELFDLWHGSNELPPTTLSPS